MGRGVAALLLTAAALSTSGGVAAAQEPPPAAREAETLLDVPFIPQSELLCGGAAAAMVLRYWGAREVDAEEFRPLVRPGEGGIRGGELAADLRRRGWRALSFAGNDAEVRGQVERGRPVVALLEVEPDRYHFVVVVAWTDRGVVHHDPARAPLRVRSPAEFGEAWRASGRWTLVVLPSCEEAGRDEPAPESTGARPAAGPGDAAATGGVCAEEVRQAVARAGPGDLAAAEELLAEAVRSSPGSTRARARAELAGLRARQERWPEAREHALQAVELDPSMDHAWRILATARFLTGDRLGALAAWNRVLEPRLQDVRVDGLDRTASIRSGSASSWRRATS